MNKMTIGQVAKKTHVNIGTVRYYERRGLIPEPSRRASGYRQYSSEAVRRIQFIKRAQELGFSLQEIAELLALRVDPQTPRGEIKRHVETKIVDIEHKIENLQAIKQALLNLSNACSGEGTASHCPILDALEPPEDGYL